MSAWEGVSTEVVRGWDDRESPARGDALPTLPAGFLETESTFYRRYEWCLDAYPSVAEVRHRLRRELSGLEEAQEGWHRDEVATNLFLLSCAMAEAVDDYLTGDSYDFSPIVAILPELRRPVRAVDALVELGRRHRAWRLRGLREWGESWRSALDGFLRAWLAAGRCEAAVLTGASAGLAALLGRELPAEFLARGVRVPAAFRTQDLTHHDILELTGRFVEAFPDRQRTLLVVGLRTAGSYFAPLVHASLAVRGYRDLDVVTLRPKKGTAPWEQAALVRGAARGARALVVDEPADTGSTLAGAVGLLRQVGVEPADVVVLLPVHPTRRDWNGGYESLPLCGTRVLTLEPEEWHKQRLLESDAVQRRMQDYFRARGYSQVAVVDSPAAESFNRRLQRFSEEKFHTRLKRVYEVRLQGHDGYAESRFVLAKSVGWGWLGYHAFLAAEALADFVPPVLGLRDGIVYTEWLPQGDPPGLPHDRDPLLRRAACYVAARVGSLRLRAAPGPELDAAHQKGIQLLASALSGAFGWKPSAVLKRARLRRALSRRVCPVPTLIDGKMRLQEWIRGPGSFLKTDFEHHGMGKTELNVTDPAYDLAEVILHLRLSPAEEQALLQHYREACADRDVEERLFLQKLLAGTAARTAALDNLRDPRLRHRHQEFNRSYIEAGEFLSAHTLRYCMRRCTLPDPPSWRSPLMVLDIDGVLDKQVFGYPSTTAAGVEALALLHAHGLAVTFNTARTLAEAQNYCRTSGCVGAVAEYGSVAWDAVGDRTRVLVTPESRHELERLASALRRIRGVFLNDHYQHSLRAYTYDRGRTMPLPGALIQGVMGDLGVDRLTVHQTYLDTTVLAGEVDKGKGLLALLDLAGCDDVETIAIGDSEADLAMFFVAGRSFAPAHIAGYRVARLLGCRIADRSYQPGLLSAVRSIVHPDGRRCPRCEPCRRPADDGLFGELLKTADRRPLGSLLLALADPMALQAFLR